jgi:hypothetical protein
VAGAGKLGHAMTVVFLAAILIGGAAGFYLGYAYAMRRTMQMIELLRLETEGYLRVLNPPEPPGDFR